jgi:hypothetical protein
MSRINFFSSFCFICNVQAQESHTDTRTKIYLHNGSKWIGQIQALILLICIMFIQVQIIFNNTWIKYSKIEQELVHSKRNKEYYFKERDGINH